MPRRLGLLTAKQLTVLVLRDRHGLGFSEIARLLGTTRQDAAAAYRRAVANAETAWETLAAYTLATGILVEAGQGVLLDELVERIIGEADAHGVRLRWARPELYMLLRGLLRGCLEGSRLAKPVAVVLRRDGSLEAYPREKVEHILEVIHSIRPRREQS